MVADGKNVLPNIKADQFFYYKFDLLSSPICHIILWKKKFPVA